MKKTYSKILSVVLALCCFLPVLAFLGCSNDKLTEAEQRMVGEWNSCTFNDDRTVTVNGNYAGTFRELTDRRTENRAVIELTFSYDGETRSMQYYYLNSDPDMLIPTDSSLGLPYITRK